jgi:addiction module HigA family antidote
MKIQIKNGMRPIHPGEILREEYLGPLHMSANALAHAIGVPANRVSSILAGVRGVTADTALRLAQAFGTSPEFWLNMQQSYDLRLAAKTAKAVTKEIRPIGEYYVASKTVTKRESFGTVYTAKKKYSGKEGKPRRAKAAKVA